MQCRLQLPTVTVGHTHIIIAEAFAVFAHTEQKYIQIYFRNTFQNAFKTSTICHIRMNWRNALKIYLNVSKMYPESIFE